MSYALDERRPPSDIDRGFEFAERLLQVVSAYGPSDLTKVEQDELTDHLRDAALAWVRERNLRLRATGGAS